MLFSMTTFSYPAMQYRAALVHLHFRSFEHLHPFIGCGGGLRIGCFKKHGTISAVIFCMKINRPRRTVMQTPDKICQRAFLVGHIFLLFYFSNLKRLIVKRFRSYALEALRVKIFANGNTVETIVPQAAI